MDNGNYVNYYIETLTNSLTDAFLRNISLQANGRVTDDVIKNLSQKVDSLTEVCGEQEKLIENLKNTNVQVESQAIKNLNDKLNEQQNSINNLSGEVGTVNTLKNENENLKSQVANIELFRNELVKERESHQQTKVDMQKIIDKLNSDIEKLKAPNKKIKPGKPETVVEKVLNKKETTTENVAVKDGGSF